MLKLDHFSNRKPDFGGLPPPCKGKELLAAEFISSGSKDTLLCSVEHKIRLMTERKKADINSEDTYGYILSLGHKSSAFLHRDTNAFPYVQMQVCHTQQRNGKKNKPTNVGRNISISI